MSANPAHVVVLGGGYAGTMAANRLRRGKDLQITLVNAHPRFVDRIRVHQFAAAHADVTADYGAVLGKGITLVTDSAEHIDTAARTVHLGSGRRLGYDYLIYAAGSAGLPGAAVPGVAEFGYQVSDLDHAARLQQALAQLPARAPVTVIGGGATGVEMAGECAEQGYATTLVSGGRLIPSLTERARRSVHEQLAAVGVRVLQDTLVTEVQRQALHLADGGPLASAVTIWAGGFAAPGLARASGLSTDEVGRVRTDETLTSIDDDRVLAAGDAAAPSGQPLRMSCQAAVPLGAMAAQTVLNRVRDRTPEPIDLGFNGLGISVGRRAATIQRLNRDDTAATRVLSGPGAVALKNLGLKFPLWGLRAEAAIPGVAVWPKGGRRVHARVT